MHKENRIADTELEIMKIAWKSKTPTTSSDIVKELKVLKGWKETTIYTLISRLVEKGFLTQDKQKQVSSYSPTISEQEHALEQTQDFIDKLFGGDAKQLVSMLYENKKIKAGDIKYLRKIWEGDGSDK
jgi:predicted transcriptional regulator